MGSKARPDSAKEGPTGGASGGEEKEAERAAGTTEEVKGEGDETTDGKGGGVEADEECPIASEKEFRARGGFWDWIILGFHAGAILAVVEDCTGLIVEYAPIFACTKAPFGILGIGEEVAVEESDAPDKAGSDENAGAREGRDRSWSVVLSDIGFAEANELGAEGPGVEGCTGKV